MSSRDTSTGPMYVQICGGVECHANRETVVCRLRTKSGNKQKRTISHYSSQLTTRACGSLVGEHIYKINTLISRFTFSSNLLWLKGNLCIKLTQMLISTPFWVRIVKQNGQTSDKSCVAKVLFDRDEHYASMGFRLANQPI